MKAFLVLIVLAFSVHAEKSYQISANAPEQTKHYAPLLGEWTITDSSLDKEGNWQQGRGADWNWYTILDGHAIQDDWISPSLSVEVEEGKRGFGTNIRIYNPTDKRWNQIWVSSNSRKFDNFTATFIDGKIVMRGFYVGNETRVTFYDMKENTFDWKMEFQDKDNPEVWKEVYRIHGDRKK
ncbi:MAG TPA: hypothetical protein PK055_00190 [Gammaproteobacteria bacterium]|nr:hypothetical protein [Xanthomonadales bacterium]MCB1593355.1 hypothetical protein [Xanthomonadales bacterium]HOP22626.1 hypothetical protein [Gammaproteobacteria bacterium]HPI94606.1 hypothetical protein [Gammaproteobacteria bacterium]HPQ86051.1 hypothetical protein [Gammaproteobacteria bacterium]